MTRLIALLGALLTLCLTALPAFATGVLGFPANGLTVSGVGVILGYHCSSKNIEIRIDGASLGPAGAGTTLLGTQATCGRTDTGFALLYNFNNLTPGTHTVRAYADGAEFGAATFNTAQSGGVAWLAGASKSATISDFPATGQVATVQWTESLQNFVITSITASGTGGYPLASAYANFIATGWSGAFTVSGDCTGTGFYAHGPAATGTTFEGQAARSATWTLTRALSNCTPASLADSGIDYYSTSYLPIGSSSADGYNMFVAPITLPATVRVGDTAIVGVETLYASAAKTTVLGTTVYSFVVEPFDATHVLVNAIGKFYSASGALEATVQERYKLSAAGQLSQHSTDFQFVGGVHLRYTY